MTLATLQRDFARAIFGAGEPSHAGLAVYRSSVLANLVDALSAAYPVVRRLVGAAFFDEAARRHALVQPSTSGDLNEYGAAFPEFLAGYPHAASLPYLRDVARLEWACHECEHAAEPPAFDFARLASVAPQDLAAIRLVVHPAVRLVASAHPIVSIHEANAPDRDGTPARTEGADFALVRRVEGGARVESLPEHEWRLLERLARGDALGPASAALPPRLAESFVPAALARYVAQGIVCGFTAP